MFCLTEEINLIRYGIAKMLLLIIYLYRDPGQGSLFQSWSDMTKIRNDFHSISMKTILVVTGLYEDELFEKHSKWKWL